jgi:hypothetical protein
MKPHRPQNTSLPVTGYFESFYLIGFSLHAFSHSTIVRGQSDLLRCLFFGFRSSSFVASSFLRPTSTQIACLNRFSRRHIPRNLSLTIGPSEFLNHLQPMPHSLACAFLFCLLHVTGIKDFLLKPPPLNLAGAHLPRNEISFFIYRFQSLFCGIKAPR